MLGGLTAIELSGVWERPRWNELLDGIARNACYVVQTSEAVGDELPRAERERPTEALGDLCRSPEGRRLVRGLVADREASAR